MFRKFITKNGKFEEEKEEVKSYTVGTFYIEAFKVVALKDNGTVVLADNKNKDHYEKVIGIALESRFLNQGINVADDNEIININWQLKTGATYFLGRDGNITDEFPKSGLIQPIGMAKNNHTLEINIGECAII